MKILKITAMLLLLISFMACKKDKTEPFDITKHSIIGKLATGHPYIITIEADGKATLTHYSVSNGKYTYTNGVFDFNFNDNEVVGAFVIGNGKIKSYNGPIIINTYDLVKIPATNQIDGKTFKGTWNNSAQLTQLKFLGTQCIEVNSAQQSGLEYTLINNLAMKREEGGNITVFILMNEKLEGGRYKYPNTFWGTFTQQ